MSTAPWRKGPCLRRKRLTDVFDLAAFEVVGLVAERAVVHLVGLEELPVLRPLRVRV